MSVLLVAVGGAVGALLRWQIARWHLARSDGRWPTGTLAANGLGTLIAAVVLALPDDTIVTLLLVVGLASGLTTFSTLVVEVVQRPPRLATAYLVVTIVVGLVAVAIGMTLA